MQEQSGNKHFLIRLIAGILILVIAVALICCFFQGTALKKKGETDFAFNRWHYSRDSMKEASTVLAKAGLTRYQWKDGCLEVPKKEKAQYETALAENRAFPKAPSDIHQEALREMGAFESESKTRLRDLYAAARQLEQTLEHFSTKIDYATVGVRSRIEQNGLNRKTVITASVGIWPKENTPVTVELISAITIASRHHLGIDKKEDISILDLRNGQSWLGTEDGLADPHKTALKEKERAYKNFLEAQFAEVDGIEIDLQIKEYSSQPTTQAVNSNSRLSTEDRPTERTGAVLGHPGYSTFAALPETQWTNVSNEQNGSQLNLLKVRIAVPKKYIEHCLGNADPTVEKNENINQLLNRFREKAQLLLAPITDQQQAIHPNWQPDIQVVLLDRNTMPSDLADIAPLNTSIMTQNALPPFPKNNTVKKEVAPEAKNESSSSLNQSTTAAPSLLAVSTGSKSNDIQNDIQNIKQTDSKSVKTNDNSNEKLVSNDGATQKDESGALPATSQNNGSPLKQKLNDLWNKHRGLLTGSLFGILAVSLLFLARLFNKNKPIETTNSNLSNDSLTVPLSLRRSKEPIANSEENDITEKDKKKRLNELFSESEPDDLVYTTEEPDYRFDLPHSLPNRDRSISEKNTEKNNTVSNSERFSFLNSFDVRQLVSLLERERAPFIAIVLRFLLKEKRDEFLQFLPEEKRRSIRTFLAQPSESGSSLIGEMEKILRERCRQLLKKPMNFGN